MTAGSAQVSSTVVVYADGGSRGNPGPAGYGSVVLAPDGTVLAERAGGLGVTTNNVAEYTGLVEGLQAARELGAHRVEVRMDSKLVVEQMSGRWKIKNPDLQVLALRARELVREFELVTFDWVPRERNKLADALANAGMDAQAEGRTWAPKRAGEVTGTDVTPAVDDELADPAAGPVLDPAGMTKLVIVRHGQTTWGAERRYAGREDVPLTERGLVEARATAARLTSIGVGAVLTSPLTRCRRTAEIIAAATSLGPAAVLDAATLVDGRLGEWTGLTAEQIEQHWPEEFSAWRSDPAVAPPDGESFDDVRDRVRTGIRDVLAQHRGRTVVLVTHAAVAKMIVVTALGAPSSVAYRTRIDNCSISQVWIAADGATTVASLNDTGHLPAG